MTQRGGSRVRTVLVGYDGRQASDDALALGIQLAELLSAKLLLVYAYDPETDSAPQGVQSGPESVKSATGEILRRGMRSLPYGVPADCLAVPRLPVAGVLQELAQSENAAMIVLGPTEFGPLSRLLVGSAAERLVQDAPCPVAVAPRDHRLGGARRIERIGVCWDGSPESEHALDFAGELAAEGPAELHLYRAVQPLMLAYPGTAESDIAYEESSTRAAEEALTRARTRVPDRVPVNTKVLRGDPARALSEQALSDKLHILVLGSRGFGPLKRTLLGGVSDRVMRMAACPTLIVSRAASAGPRANTVVARA